MGVMDFMMAKMMGAMSQKDKDIMMDRMMDKMLGDMTVQERQEMMLKMMPKMMEEVSMLELLPRVMLQMAPMLIREVRAYLEEAGVAPADVEDIMPALMGRMMPAIIDGVGWETLVEMKEGVMKHMNRNETIDAMMPEMRTHMMPGCVKDMLPKLSKEKRVEFAVHILTLLRDVGGADFNEAERAEYLKTLSSLLER